MKKPSDQLFKIHYVLDNLRRMKVVGNTSKDQVAHLMYQSEDTLLLRYMSNRVLYSSFILVRRTSRQCYSVIALTSLYDDRVVIKKSFKTNDSTCHWIKEIIRRY